MKQHLAARHCGESHPEDVWGNSRLEGLQGEDRDYVYDRGRTTVSEQWRAGSMLVDEGFQSY